MPSNHNIIDAYADINLLVDQTTYQGCSSLCRLQMITNFDKATTISLYSQNSKSIPWQIPQNKWSHLNPQWRFIDLNGNVVSEIKADNFQLIDNINKFTSVIEFAYIDDMPSEDVVLWVVANFNDSHPPFINSQVAASAIINVEELIPDHLEITKDGKDPFLRYYWKNAKIPYVVSVIGTTPDKLRKAVMKNIPSSNEEGITIGPLTVSALISSEDNTTVVNTDIIGYLSANDSQDFCVGGYLDGSFKFNEASENAFLSASIDDLSGVSDTFDILDPCNYNIRRFNESWDAINEVKKYAVSPHIADNPFLWDDYLGSLYGSASSEQGKGFGRQIYEKISNFSKNHTDISYCNVDQLYNLSHLVDVPIDDYGLNFPVELKRIMDIGSVKQQYLWGNKCRCNKNITNNKISFTSGGEVSYINSLCLTCNHYHPGNKGDLFDPSTYMVSSCTPFILHERASNIYSLIQPPPIRNTISSNPSNIDSCSEDEIDNIEYIYTYPLSAYYTSLLPKIFEEHINFDQAITYFCFYKYEGDVSCDKQVNGLINWEDKYTTLHKDISSTEEWYDDKLEKIINFTLYKGLGLIDETDS